MHSAESSHDEIKTLFSAFLEYDKSKTKKSEHTRDGLWPGKYRDFAKDHHSCVLPTLKSHSGGFMYGHFCQIHQTLTNEQCADHGHGIITPKCQTSCKV
jgi:hypothetical protein